MAWMQLALVAAHSAHSLLPVGQRPAVIKVRIIISILDHDYYG
jgi:hypothetical protein